MERDQKIRDLMDSLAAFDKMNPHANMASVDTHRQIAESLIDGWHASKINRSKFLENENSVGDEIYVER